jgi:hypothetical protein
MNPIVNFPLLVFVFSFAAMLLAARIGDALRKKVHRLQEEGGSDFGVVLTGTLTLLGLIIGFSISMAISRYDLRKNYEQAEANAIAIEYVRADLLPAGDAARVHQLLKTYLEQRVLFYTTRDQGQLRRIADDTAQLQNELWSAVRSAIAAVAPPLEGIVVSGMNDVVLSQRSSQGAGWNRIPVSVWVLMAAISIGCNFLIGYRARRTDWLVFLIMPVAVSISLFMISDLDSPRGGAIRVAPQNLLSLSQSLHTP